MIAEQVVTNQTTMWLPKGTATRDLSEVLSHMAIEDLKSRGFDIIVSVSDEVFDWESAEQHADWEEKHNRFMEFSDVKDLLADLHS